MDLTIIKIVDALLDPDTDEVTRLYVPTILKKSDIEYVAPNITKEGKLYKTMSVLKTYSGDSHVVIGNYKKLSKEVENKYIIKNIGYR